MRMTFVNASRVARNCVRKPGGGGGGGVREVCGGSGGVGGVGARNPGRRRGMRGAEGRCGPDPTGRGRPGGGRRAVGRRGPREGQRAPSRPDAVGAPRCRAATSRRTATQVRRRARTLARPGARRRRRTVGPAQRRVAPSGDTPRGRAPELALQLGQSFGQLGGAARDGDVGVGRAPCGPVDVVGSERGSIASTSRACARAARCHGDAAWRMTPWPMIGEALLGQHLRGGGITFGGRPSLGRAHRPGLEEQVLELGDRGSVRAEPAAEAFLDRLDVWQGLVGDELLGTVGQRAVQDGRLDDLARPARQVQHPIEFPIAAAISSDMFDPSSARDGVSMVRHPERRRHVACAPARERRLARGRSSPTRRALAGRVGWPTCPIRPPLPVAPSARGRDGPPPAHRRAAVDRDRADGRRDARHERGRAGATVVSLGVRATRVTALPDDLETVADAFRDALAPIGPGHHDRRPGPHPGRPDARGAGTRVRGDTDGRPGPARLAARPVGPSRDAVPRCEHQAGVGHPIGDGPAESEWHGARLARGKAGWAGRRHAPGTAARDAADVAGRSVAATARAGAGSRLVVRTLRLTGIGELQVADRLGEAILRATNPIVATMHARTRSMSGSRPSMPRTVRTRRPSSTRPRRRCSRLSGSSSGHAGRHRGRRRWTRHWRRGAGRCRRRNPGRAARWRHSSASCRR